MRNARMQHPRKIALISHSCKLHMFISSSLES